MIDLFLLGVVGALDIFILIRLRVAFRRLTMPVDLPVQKDLPTVSICITARDETHAMTQCLERVVASDYPKLEVIVLDDGSRDDTSMLIKSFAHAGVRFVEGKPLPEDWLGKNYAQAMLADEASGKYILFMDVDTLIERHTVARLVSYLLFYKAKMVSVVPLRNNRWESSTLVTTMRYYWAMVRFTPTRPRAVSNAWLIERKLMLDELQNDTSLQKSMLMETTIARKLAAEKAYRLVMSSSWLGVRFEKKWSSQVETSIRLLYPQCDAFWLQVIWLVVLLGVTLIPYAVVWWQPWAGVLVALQYLIAYYYLSRVWVRYRFVGALLLPFTIAQEIALLIVSLYQYKLGVVTWKGRPIQVYRK
ncbi:MAG: glycosyltransferase [Candidatus Nomurabacteria bacterium]|nr:MAG: glycosyltransferase [Candidatus Nomurabacteria bacterium]